MMQKVRFFLTVSIFILPVVSAGTDTPSLTKLAIEKARNLKICMDANQTKDFAAEINRSYGYIQKKHWTGITNERITSVFSDFFVTAVTQLHLDRNRALVIASAACRQLRILESDEDSSSLAGRILSTVLTSCELLLDS